MNIREITEKIERETLSEYAMLSEKSKGRLYHEEKCNIRTEYQRDRDRIIHSKAFRRLKHKTQVFIAPEGDHFRTRLTHTLEVSQISRTIARGLRLNEDLTEAIALGHDLGHTPFGHTGEDVLNSIFVGGFKHNEQSLRVVDLLEREGGLNLTFEVRDGILNHTGDAIPSTLEGQVVKISDKIAYINHDIDDAIRGGILELSDIPREYLEVLGLTHKERINTMVTDVITNSIGKNIVSMSEKVHKATLGLREFLFKNVYIGSRAKKEEEKAKNMLEFLYYYFVKKPEKLPDEYVKRIDVFGLERVVCDYIAGMTDRYAIQVFHEIFVPKPWQVY